MNSKVVYLMRGLPSCGKSRTARSLAGQTGVVCETDEYFYSQVGDDPTRYDYREDLLGAAQEWNLERFRKALEAGATPIIVDRGNGLSVKSQIYARLAVNHGYRVELKEPESPWWQEIRLLLEDKAGNRALLDAWAQRLSAMSQTRHRVPVSVIRHRMEKWKCDLTVEEILNYKT